MSDYERIEIISTLTVRATTKNKQAMEEKITKFVKSLSSEIDFGAVVELRIRKINKLGF